MAVDLLVKVIDQGREERVAQNESIYRGTQVELVVKRAGSTPPVIMGIGNGASFLPALAPGAWISIVGKDLAPVTRAWRADDIVDGNLPVQLEGVSVTVNGKAVPIAFISPTQLNVQVPPDAIADSLERLLLDGERWQRRSREGIEFVAAHTWDKATDEVEAGLRHALRFHLRLVANALIRRDRIQHASLRSRQTQLLNGRVIGRQRVLKGPRALHCEQGGQGCLMRLKARAHPRRKCVS